jgi:hypothetical protein
MLPGPFEVFTDTLVFLEHMVTRDLKTDDAVESSTVSVRGRVKTNQVAGLRVPRQGAPLF